MIEEELRIESVGGVVLAGTLTLPAASGTFPVLVGAHGSGGGTRAAPLFQHLQSVLPQHGMATFIFDRRGEGQSTGVPFDAGFEVLGCSSRRREAEPWFELAHLPDLGGTRRLGMWTRTMDFDVRPALRQLRLPVLLIFGERDRWVPIEESLARWWSGLGPNADLTVFRVPGGGHSPTLALIPKTCRSAGPSRPNTSGRWSPGFRIASVSGPTSLHAMRHVEVHVPQGSD